MTPLYFRNYIFVNVHPVISVELSGLVLLARDGGVTQVHLVIRIGSRPRVQSFIFSIFTAEKNPVIARVPQLSG